MRLRQRLDELWSDVRFAIRQLAGSPGFTSLAVITLALGIGANSAIFALVDTTLIRPLPFPDPDRLVMVWERPPAAPRGFVAPLNFHDWHERNRTFESMAALFNYARRLSAADGSTEQVPAQQVTPAFFNLLLSLVLGNAGRLIGTGAVVGLVMAALLAQSISTFLFGVRPLDPLTFAGVIAVLGATALIASVVPDSARPTSIRSWHFEMSE